MPDWLSDFIADYDLESDSVMGSHGSDPERTYVLMSVADWRRLSAYICGDTQ